MKFLHTADWQVGMRATQLGEKGERVRHARLESARRVIEEARREKVDFVVVAGDTFENNGVDRLKVREVAKILGGAGCPVYLIPGNHDASDAGFRLGRRGLGRIPKPACPQKAGAGRSSRRESFTRARCSPAIPRKTPPPGSTPIRARSPSVLLMAAWKTPGTSRSCRSPGTRLRLRGLDYLALGHFHSKTLYADDDGAFRMAYSGTHEATGFTEHASGNVLIVEIPNRGAAPQIQTVRTGSLEWLSYRRKIEQPGEIGELAAELDALPAPERTLVECVLEGTLFGHDHEALGKVMEIIEGRFLFGRAEMDRLVADQSGPEWFEHLPNGYLQDAARDLLEKASGEPPDAVAAAALMEFARLWREAV